MYDLSDPTSWYKPGVITLYRSTPASGAFQPDDPFQSSGGRFSGNSRLTLYLSDSSEGTVAEWLRHNPEFITIQSDLRIKLTAVTIECNFDVLDITTDQQAEKINFPFDRLVSSENNPNTRYRECRNLADDADKSAGITYTNAAIKQHELSNTVFFGKKGDRWNFHGYIEVKRPIIDPESIELIEQP